MKSKLILTGKIILPPALCVVIIYFLKTYIDFQFIVTFGIIIILFNKNKTKHSFNLSLLYSILLCFLVLVLSMGVGNLIYIIKDELFINLLPNDFLKRLHIIPKSIVSPLLMFYSYKLLFKIENTNYFRVIKWTSVLIMIAFGLSNLFFVNENLFVLWQFIMALALQLILYKKEIFELINRKNTAYNNGYK